MLGYANARFELTDDGSWGFFHSIFNKSGYQLGAGLTHHLYPRLALRLDDILVQKSIQHRGSEPECRDVFLMMIF